MKSDALTAERIGLTWLRAALAPVGDFGRRADDAVRAFGPGDEVAACARAEQVVTLAASLTSDGVAQIRAALRRIPEPSEIVSRANAGDALGDVDFFELGRFGDALEFTARAWDAAGGAEQQRPPVVPQIGGLLARGRRSGAFYLADEFAATLAAARNTFACADAAVGRERARLTRNLAAPLAEPAEGQEFIVMRDVAPVLPAGLRVIRETPAYRVVALELDAPALMAMARRDDAFSHVAAHEDLVRRELATALARESGVITAAVTCLGELDRLLARVAFTQTWGGCVPTLSDGRMAFESASFVPLRTARTAAGLPYTPISLELDGTAVLTGPNMGGKSTALATCGFLAACVSVGVPPPAIQATLPLLDSVAWIGGEIVAGRERLLSAFGGEVVRVRDVLAGAGCPALVLVDEFARTTGPREGRALLVALVEELARRSVTALVTTHFDGVARAAGVPHLTIAGLGGRSLETHAARDVHAALDAVARAMDYRIVRADDDASIQSDALALAGLLGLNTAIVERAAELFAGAGAGPCRAVTE